MTDDTPRGPRDYVVHAGDVTRMAFSKWRVAWHVASRMLFGRKTTDASPAAAPRLEANASQH